MACAAAAIVLLVALVRPPEAPTTPVVVAARALPAGVDLAAADLHVVRVAAHPAPAGAVASPGTLLGRRLATRVEPGEPITLTRLMPRSPADGLAPGTVAAHLTVGDVGALDLVEPGSRVDLFADVGGPALAQDVLVLAVDTPGSASLTGSLPGAETVPPGLFVALDRAGVTRIFAGQRPDGAAPRVLPVVSG
ncbi:flagellar protein FlgA [Knoellia sinensis KCTC 19936]|uniref:Flagellar protein FlgA n=1 Tax=Knoellia sinensis KCTC 19936 TaxID=1385520 RepID=A0A0A0J0F9_9MICO|nr:flagellar protein FlgA [Knoellia sinensis KCTC 19936]